MYYKHEISQALGWQRSFAYPVMLRYVTNGIYLILIISGVILELFIILLLRQSCTSIFQNTLGCFLMSPYIVIYQRYMPGP